MKKIRKVLEFILALLNFLFHFKPVPDETPPISPESFPLPDYQDLEKRNEPLFESSLMMRAWGSLLTVSTMAP